MSNHSITYDLQYPEKGTWTCKAPPEAFCHAVFDCDCEQIWHYRIKDGVPMHDSSPYKELNVVHVGRFDSDQCSIEAFYTEGEEVVDGKIIVDVETSWEGEWYSFEAASAEVQS